MRILWATPQCPDLSGGGGSQHEYELLRVLSRSHDIEVLSTCGHADGLDRVPLSIVNGWTPRRGPVNKRERAWLELSAREPMVLWPLRARIEPLRVEIAKHNPDLVHMMLGELAPALSTARSATSILLFDSYTRHAKAAVAIERSARKRALGHLEIARSQRFERRWYRLSDGLACVTKADAHVVQQLVHRPVDVIPNPIAPEYFEQPGRPRMPNTVLFVGSMGYPPNIDALRWFVSDVWPRIVRVRPDATFRAVGRAKDDPSAVAALRELLGDRLQLDVEDVRPYYWEAAVTVAPMRLGAGLKNKVIHAMACGSPVVSTSRGAEGCGATPNDDFLCADDAIAFADAVLETFDDPSRAQERARRARMVVERFATDRVAAAVENWWDATLRIHGERVRTMT